MHRKRTVLIGLSAVWAGVIFMFSAQPADISSKLSGGLIKTVCTFLVSQFKFLSIAQQEIYIESFQFIVRKTAHFSVYLILGILVLSAIMTYRYSTKRSVLITAVICFLYACSDEIHQIFVPGRAGKFGDVVIDTLGALTGIAFIYLLRKIIMRKKPSA